MERRLATVSASTGVMNSALAKLTALLGEQHKLQKSVGRDIALLRDELYTMACLLEKVADSEDSDAQLKGWMKQIREMCYDVEDCIDKFSATWDGAEQVGFLRRASRRISNLKMRHEVQNRIRELRLRVCEASERRSRYSVDAGLGSHQSIRPVNIELDPRPALHAESDTLPVGMDEPMSRLTEWLDEDTQEKQRRVAAIVGMGGIGKTRLAMEVYGGPGRKFDRRVFVSVHRRFHLSIILMSILSQVTAQEYANKRKWGVQQLIDAIRTSLEDKRYFIVIDDIWSVEAWHIINCALPENGSGSRVLVATRSMGVAMSCFQNDGSYVLFMEPLTEVDARKLFLRRVKHNCPTDWDEYIIHEILKFCSGLPLTINIIAGLLANKSSRAEEWKQVRNSISSGVDEYSTLTVLRLSYLHLPFQLKTCLLYLSIFPEDKTIDRELLVRRWIAEGFITGEHEGETYFNELINRSLIQPMDIQYSGRAQACKVHDLVMDFIQAKSAEENFVTIYSSDDGRFELRDTVRRLSLDCRCGEYTFEPTATTTSNVRSLAIFGSDNEMPTLKNFRALRVLDLECTELQEDYLVPIGRLCLLKYLRIQTTSDIELPRQIEKLQFLETLDLSGVQIRTLPRSIVRLKRLIYLLVNNVNLPAGIGNLQALQKLSHVKVDSRTLASSLNELGGLAALRFLGLNWCISDIATCKKSYADNLVSSLNQVMESNLQYLYMRSEDECSLDFLLHDSLSGRFYGLQEFRMNSKYHFPSVPKWVSSLVNLSFLEINIDPVGEEALHVLAELPQLLVLLLSTKSTSLHQELIIRDGGFRRLQQFDFTCFNSWAILLFGAGAMRNLEKLRLVFSAQGERVPNGFRFGIEHLASLKHLVVEINCWDVRASVVNAAEDAIKNEVRVHPNRPILEFIREDEVPMEKDKMKTIVRVEEKAGLNEGSSGVEHEIAVEKVSTVTIES